MNLIVCLDDNRGMQFNKRRQSRDRLLIEKLAEQVGDAKLYISPYSEPLFQKSSIEYTVSENPTQDAKDADYCFVEQCDPAALEPSVSSLLLFYWNRVYPADLYFTMNMSRFRLVDTVDFVGSSHEKITMEVWKK